MNEEQENRLRAAMEYMDMPDSASTMLDHSAALFDAITILVEVLDESGVMVSDVAQALVRLVAGDEVQHDLRIMAEWFRRHPYSDNNAWLGTTAAKQYSEKQREEDSDSEDLTH